MEPFFTNYLSNLLELHTDIRQQLAGLPQNAIDWSPGAEINPMGVLVFHLTGSERYWVGDVVAGEPSGRDRDAEFKVTQISVEQLLQRLSGTEDYIRIALEPLSLLELEKDRISPRNGREVTVGWALDHALKHTAIHVGHIQMMRQLWEQSHPMV